MDMQNYTTPFANTGDREEFSIGTDPSGKVSLEKGWTELYQLRPEEGGLFILRKVFNQMMKLVSTDTVTWKTQSFPNWINDKGDGTPFAYPKNAIVKYTNGNTYVSLVNNNTQVPTGANWKLFDITALDNTVKLTGNQTIAGVKTFSNQIIATTTSSASPGAGFLAYGNGTENTIAPSIGFVQPELFSGAIKMINAGTFGFFQSDGTTKSSVEADLIGNATTVTNGVYTTGNQTIAGVKTFSSSPIVPTPTAGTQVVNKDYADLKVALASFIGTNQSLLESGYQKLPGGLIIQWGRASSLTLSGNILFPISFPNACLNATVFDVATASLTSPYPDCIWRIDLTTKSNLGYEFSSNPALFGWIAIGH